MSAADPKPTATPTVMTEEERIAFAKDLYGRGSRNYLVKDYAEAADDLSEVCAMYAEIYGDEAHELGMPYLLYAKSLIALAQGGENKLLEVPEENEEDDDEDDDDEEEDAPPAEGATETGAGSSSAAVTNGSAPKEAATANGSAEPQPGGSSGAAPTKETDDTDAAEEEDDDTPAANLQVAWEVLELAVKIFDREGAASASNLADAYFELAEISLENSHFETAVRDYNNSLDIHMKLPDNNLRLIAEIQYKIGLGNLMLGAYDVSIVAFRKACEVLDAEIANQQTEPANAERAAATVEELQELKLEIVNKIVEVEEAQQQSVAEVKEKLAKLMSTQSSTAGSDGSSSAAASSGQSSSSSAAGGSSAAPSTVASKPTDISHLIKRKNPTQNASSEGSPAKKPAL